ncbi:MAG: hypothetical protein WCG21_14785 [Eubacteriales bacterium]
MNLPFLNLHKSGFTIARIFYGTWLLPLGLLVFRSGFLLPGYDIITYPGLAIGFAAEFSLSLWLLIKGAKEPLPAQPTQNE